MAAFGGFAIYKVMVSIQLSRALANLHPATAVMVTAAFFTLVVFLCLAALYESWSVPTAALMIVPALIFTGAAVNLWKQGVARVEMKRAADRYAQGHADRIADGRPRGLEAARVAAGEETLGEPRPRAPCLRRSCFGAPCARGPGRLRTVPCRRASTGSHALSCRQGTDASPPSPSLTSYTSYVSVLPSVGRAHPPY